VVDNFPIWGKESGLESVLWIMKISSATWCYDNATIILTQYGEWYLGIVEDGSVRLIQRISRKLAELIMKKLGYE
jgi:hypothetical protein